MWLSVSLWLPALACLAQAASDSAHLFVFEFGSGHNLQEPSRKISPEAARLIIASNLRLDKHHDLGNVDQDTISAINDFAPQRQLAASSELPFYSVFLTQGDDALDAMRMSKLDGGRQLEITPVPSMETTEDLFVSYALQSGWNYPATGKKDVLELLRNGVSSTEESHRFEITRDIRDLKLKTEAYHGAGAPVIVLVMPNTTTKSTAKYGAWTLPNTKHQKREQKEMPLEADPVSSTHLAATLSPAASSNGSSNATGPLRGILPHCFRTLSACQALTRNCTGHGSCQLRYTDRDAGSSESGQNTGKCYSCQCKADVRTNKDGTTKTTGWGGPACQKKDVVAPFWLLAGFSVGLVFLVSWGIGTLLTMGNEELPSVIGAGVSGVPKR